MTAEDANCLIPPADKVCAPWLAEYLHEMGVFPNGKHDAQVD
jgi:phage terminase large subunit-like protein